METKETLEEESIKYADNYFEMHETNHYKALKQGFEAGANYQAERSYSEEDLKEAFKGGGKMSWTDINQETQEPYYKDFKEWFEQFKKK